MSLIFGSEGAEEKQCCNIKTFTWILVVASIIVCALLTAYWWESDSVIPSTVSLVICGISLVGASLFLWYQIKKHAKQVASLKIVGIHVFNFILYSLEKAILIVFNIKKNRLEEIDDEGEQFYKVATHYYIFVVIHDALYTYM